MVKAMSIIFGKWFSTEWYIVILEHGWLKSESLT